MSWNPWPAYVPVSKRRDRATKAVARLRKQGLDVEPVESMGRSRIARTFWGRAWCDHLESYRDLAYRLERGRSYVRHGAVCHLAIAPGAVEAKVMGSALYDVKVAVDRLPDRPWREVKSRCAGGIASLIELLEGRLSEEIMSVVTDREKGLFPQPNGIHFDCSCPDHARMCKHVAAVLYGVGARFDARPELLFVLRGVDHDELIAADAGAAIAGVVGAGGSGRRIDEGDVADVFGIELANAPGDAAADDGKSRPGAKKSRASKGRSESAPTRAVMATSRVAGKARPGRTRAPATSGSPPPPSASAAREGYANEIPSDARQVEQLRRDLGLTRAQFSCLLGVSVATVANWERADGPLKFQDRTRRALGGVLGLTTAQARRRLRARGG